MMPLLCSAPNSHLVVIDVQTRLTNAMLDAASLVNHCSILLRSATTLNITTTITEQYPKGLGTTDTLLQQVFPAGITAIEKTCFSCCGARQFTQRLAETGKKQIILTGIEAHVCVLQTAMDLIQQGQQVFVVADAVDSRTANNKNIALSRMQQAGAIITNTESVLFEWLKDAKHEHFKTLSALIR
ncbi:MAG: isochorismatase family protein [Gammaproteobacteria bacterium]|nr:isochorismatase family protein [Gammaproteobacteria bacterium]